MTGFRHCRGREVDRSGGISIKRQVAIVYFNPTGSHLWNIWTVFWVKSPKREVQAVACDMLSTQRGTNSQRGTKNVHTSQHFEYEFGSICKSQRNPNYCLSILRLQLHFNRYQGDQGKLFSIQRAKEVMLSC